jgi:hypothetical protein
MGQVQSSQGYQSTQNGPRMFLASLNKTVKLRNGTRVRHITYISIMPSIYDVFYNHKSAFVALYNKIIRPHSQIPKAHITVLTNLNLIDHTLEPREDIKNVFISAVKIKGKFFCIECPVQKRQTVIYKQESLEF